MCTLRHVTDSCGTHSQQTVQQKSAVSEQGEINITIHMSLKTGYLLKIIIFPMKIAIPHFHTQVPYHVSYTSPFSQMISRVS